MDEIRPDDYTGARQTAISFLGLAKKPSGRVRRQLLDKGFDIATTDQVVFDLTEAGYLDDYLIATRIARQRQGRQGEAKPALERRMSCLGLRQAAIERALNETTADPERADDLLKARFAVEMAQIRQADNAGEKTDDLRIKIIRFLLRRGFSETVARRALADNLEV